MTLTASIFPVEVRNYSGAKSEWFTSTESQILVILWSMLGLQAIIALSALHATCSFFCFSTKDKSRSTTTYSRKVGSERSRRNAKGSQDSQSSTSTETLISPDQPMVAVVPDTDIKTFSHQLPSNPILTDNRRDWGDVHYANNIEGRRSASRSVGHGMNVEDDQETFSAPETYQWASPYSSDDERSPVRHLPNITPKGMLQPQSRAKIVQRKRKAATRRRTTYCSSSPQHSARPSVLPTVPSKWLSKKLRNGGSEVSETRIHGLQPFQPNL